MSEQPNVLWLADMLESCSLHVGDIEQYHAGIALRRLHEVNAELLEALQDMHAGWKYIRSFHGDLYGVGWDRAQDKAEAAISRALGQSKGE